MILLFDVFPTFDNNSMITVRNLYGVVVQLASENHDDRDHLENMIRTSIPVDRYDSFTVSRVSEENDHSYEMVRNDFGEMVHSILRDFGHATLCMDCSTRFKPYDPDSCESETNWMRWEKIARMLEQVKPMFQMLEQRYPHLIPEMKDNSIVITREMKADPLGQITTAWITFAKQMWSYLVLPPAKQAEDDAQHRLLDALVAFRREVYTWGRYQALQFFM